MRLRGDGLSGNTRITEAGRVIDNGFTRAGPEAFRTADQQPIDSRTGGGRGTGNAALRSPATSLAFTIISLCTVLKHTRARISVPGLK